MSVETVNGKIDLGIRKLVVSYVENATSLYAYETKNTGFMSEIGAKVADACRDFPEQIEPVVLSAVVSDVIVLYAALSEMDGIWYRAKVETLNVRGGKVRVRYVDFGFNEIIPPKNLRRLLSGIVELPVYCEKYKMADLKPKGKQHGFSAEDREKGAEWLRKTIRSHIIKAHCHEVVAYKGGIMIDCEVNGNNLNNLALKKGFAVPMPVVNGKLGVGSGGGTQPFLSGYADPVNSWDWDYLEHGRTNAAATVAVGGRGDRHQQLAPFGSLFQNETHNQHRQQQQMQANQQTSQQVQKLKATVANLESTLGKKNKEINELKKIITVKQVGEVIEKIRDLRSQFSMKKSLKDSARLLTDVFQALKTLSGKSEDAEKACTMLRQCKEQIENNEAAVSGLQKALKGAKKAVERYVGNYVTEYDILEKELNESCRELQKILESRQKNSNKVKELLETNKDEDQIIQEALKQINLWATEYDHQCQKDDHEAKESLVALCKGLNDASMCLVSLNEGPTQRFSSSVPALQDLINNSHTAFSKQLVTLSRNSSNAAYVKALNILGQAIQNCLNMKAEAAEAVENYRTILQLLSL